MKLSTTTLLWSSLLAYSTLSTAQKEIPLKTEHDEELSNPQTSANLNLNVAVTFPELELFNKLELVNNKPTNALVTVVNNELENTITIRYIGATLSSIPAPDQTSVILRNLSTMSYNLKIPAGEQDDYKYTFQTEMHPQDVVLNIAALVSDDNQKMYTVNLFNTTARIVEAPTSMFDPQIIFLYLILASAFAGVSYFIYNTWITTLFPQQKKRPAGSGIKSRTPKSGRKGDATDPSSPADDSPAVATGAAAYDASWIPAHHLQRPEAKRARSGTPSSPKVKKAN